MKIHELFETPIVQLDKGPSEKKANQIWQKKGQKLGSGFFASAYNVPKDIESVVKVARYQDDDPKEDGYFAYINKIKSLEHFAYLPQIHEIVQVKPKTGKPYLVVNIERLIPCDEMTWEEQFLVLERMLGRELTKAERENLSPAYTISELLTSYVIYGKPASWQVSRKQIITDPELIRVLKIVRNLRQQGFTEDLHTGNFMFRRTKFGPQLVLTDPLAFHSGDPVKVKAAAANTHHVGDSWKKAKRTW
jgi:hypothetical protein